MRTIWKSLRAFVSASRMGIVVALCLFVALHGGGSSPLLAQDSATNREAMIKAAYIYQFIRYVQWPDHVLGDKETPLTIGVVGEDAVNRYLKLIARKRAVGGRPIFYRELDKKEEAKSCQIVFISAGVPEKRTKGMLKSVAGLPVLLVGEKPSFLKDGGVISFVRVDNNVRIKISLTTASKHHLKISSQLAKLSKTAP